MNYENKSKKELILEIEKLQSRIMELEGNSTSIHSDQPIALLVNNMTDTTHKVNKNLEVSDYNKVDAEIQYYKLLDSLPSMVAVTVDEIIIYVNSTFVKGMGGISNRDFIGLNMNTLIPETSIERARKNIQEMIVYKKPLLLWETKLKKLDGELIDIETNVSFLEINKKISIQVIMNDVTERNRTREIAKIKNEQYKVLFDNSLNPIAVFDDAKYHVDANDAYCQFVECNKEELSGKKLTDFLVSIDKDQIEDNFNSLVNKGRFIELEYLVKGHKKLLNQSITVLDRESKKLYYSIGIDITEKRYLEKEMFRGETAIHAILNAVSETIYMTDLNGIILAANSTAIKRFGTNLEEILGKSLFDLLPPDITEKRKKFIKIVKESGKPLRINEELRNNYFYYSIYPTLDFDGNVDRFVFFGIDISDLIVAERAIDKSEKKYNTLIENIHDSTFVVDRSGVLHFLNNRFAKLLGGTKEIYIEKNIWDYLAEEYIVELMDEVNSSLERNIFIDKPLKLNIGGQDKWFDARVQPLMSESNDPDKSLVILNDITEQKKAEFEITERHDQLLSMFDGIDEIIYVSDPETYKILFMNKKLINIFGNSVGKVCYQIFQNSEVPCSFCTNKEIFGDNFGKSYVWESQNPITKQWYNCTDRAIKWSNGNYVRFEMASDITDLKISQKLLEEKEKSLRALLDATTETLCMIDLEGKVIIANSKAAQSFGLAVDEIIGKSLFDQFPPELAESRRNGGLDVIQTGKNVRFEDERNGHYFEISIYPVKDYNGDINAFAIFAQDITYRKEAEMILSESEKKYRLLFETMDQGVIYLNSDGLIISANLSAQRILGLSLDQIIGKTFIEPGWHSIHEDGSVFSAETHPSMIALRTGQPVSSITMGIYHPALNNYRWILLSAIPQFCDGEKKPFQVYTTFTDITKHKEVETALSYDAFLLENVSDAIISIDLSYIILTWNKAAEQLYGWAASEKIGTPLYSILRPEIPDEKHIQIISDFFEKGSWKGEVIQYRKDGSKIYILSSIILLKDKYGTNLGIVTANRDITDRKEQEEMLKTSELLLRKSQKLSKIGNWRWIVETDIVAWSEEMYNIAGIDPKLPAPKLIEQQNLYSPESWSNLNTVVESSLRSGNPYIIDLELIRPDGTKRWIISNAEPILNEDNIVTGLWGTVQDVTERKQMELTLKESNIKLQATLQNLNETQKQIIVQENLRVLGQMASGIAHDINNSLVPILGYVELLLDEEDILDKAGKKLSVIQTCSLDIKKTLNRMREFYKPDFNRDEFIPLKLTKIIQSVIEFTKHRWKDIPESEGKVIKVIQRFTDNKAIIFGNESEIREAVMNLVLNACDAMPEGGELKFLTTSIDDKIIFELEDTGIGMDEEAKKKCMDLFYTTKGEKGSGLGLSMVYGIIKRHDAEMEIESEKGKGTKIKIIFPSENLLRVEDQKKINEIKIPPLNILLIDDDYTVLQSMKDVLTKAKHQISTADSGENGLKIFFDSRSSGNIFDLVITDLGMPYMDGKSVAEVIKKDSPKIPIILLTGWGSMVDHSKFTCVDKILTKPADKITLYTAIKEVIEKKY